MLKTLSFAAATATLMFAAATAVTAQSSGPEPMPVADYTVFVDPPTGFVFVKLPQGWKFAGKVDDQAVAHLPGSVVTALLKDEGESALAAREGGAAAAMR